MKQCQEIKQNLTGQENFEICFLRNFLKFMFHNFMSMIV